MKRTAGVGRSTIVRASCHNHLAGTSSGARRRPKLPLERLVTDTEYAVGYECLATANSPEFTVQLRSAPRPIVDALMHSRTCLNYQLPTTNYQLPTTNYQLPTTNYPPSDSSHPKLRACYPDSRILSCCYLFHKMPSQWGYLNRRC